MEDLLEGLIHGVGGITRWSVGLVSASLRSSSEEQELRCGSGGSTPEIYFRYYRHYNDYYNIESILICMHILYMMYMYIKVSYGK